MRMTMKKRSFIICITVFIMLTILVCGTKKLCSSCPYKNEFYETLENIRGLQPKLE